MRAPRPTAVATALLAGVAGVAGSYLVAGATEAFVGAAAGSLLTRAAPGSAVTFGITRLGDLAQPLAFATGLALVVAAYAAATALVVPLGRRSAVPYSAAIFAGAAGWLLTTLATGAPVAALGAALPMFLVVAIASYDPHPGRRAPFEPARRRVLALAAGVGGLGIGSYLSRRGEETAAAATDLDLDAGTRADLEAKLDEAAEKSLGVDGMEPLVSRDFYEVDINSVDPNVDRGGWHLRVHGAVERSLTLSYDDLRTFPVENRFVTLRCVGESLNGHKMDTALWTGIPIAPLLDRATPRSDCECVMLEAADGYFEEFPIEALRRGFLAFGMNGEPLPRSHGYPVRALIPGHWGEINVKWLTEIRFLEREQDGYWERRGWHGTGPVKTVAKLHAVNRLGDGRVEVGGHAYAGLRGIGAVEVSTDGGDSWTNATLSAPLPGEDVWRQWRHAFTLDGPAEVVVRAVEADGTVQPRDESGPFPSGPSGWVSRTIEPRG